MPELPEDFLARLRAFVRRRLPSAADADDVLQTVLLRLQQRGAAVAATAVHGWLFAVARSAIADHYRRRERAPGQLADEPADAPAARREIAGCLEPLLSELNPADAELLAAVDRDGGSQVELAAAAGISVSGMKSRVQRARARLRATLEACCELELDARGLPTDAFRSRRPDGPCRCG